MINSIKANFVSKSAPKQAPQVVTTPIVISPVDNIEEPKKQEPINQKLPSDLYFINMKHYGKDIKWADNMLYATEKITDLIREKANFETVLLNIEDYIREFNPQAGIYGRRRDPWDNSGAYQIHDYKRGEEYFQRYYDRYPQLKEDGTVINIKSNRDYPKANTCKITRSKDDSIFIKYGKSDVENIHLAQKEYDKLLSSKNPSIGEINKSVATIHWLMAQESPYSKGSDSVANLLTKSIYNAYNVKLSPIKDGQSFDFEAFYTNLDDYIKIYPDLFKIKPYIINSFALNA